VFSLGAVLYFLLTRQPLYDAATVGGILLQAAHADYDALALEKNRVPKRLAAVCRKALAREPQARFATAAEMATALRAAVRPSRWRGVAALAGLLLAAVACGCLLGQPARHGPQPVRESNRPALEVWVWQPKLRCYIPLREAIPMNTGDELQVRLRLPAGMHLGLCSIGGRGELRLLRQYPPRHTATELVYPGPNQTKDLGKQQGTEVLFVCGRANAAINEAELQAAWHADAPWPALDSPRLLRLQPAQVREEGELSRGLGDTHDRAACRLEAAEPVAANDLTTVLDEELARLPDKYRQAILLCDLEEKGRKEVAGQLGCPEGTVASRLARARHLLAKRLRRRGLDLSVAALTTMLSANVTPAAVPPAWLASTMRAVNTLVRGGAGAAEGLSAGVAALLEGAMKKMLLAKLKWATAMLLVFGVLTGGTAALSYRVFATKPPQANKKARTPLGAGRTPMVEVWQQRAVLKDHGDLVYGVAFAPNGKWFATAGGDGSVKVWETAHPRLKATLGDHESRALAVTFSPDGKILASGHTGMVKLWDVAKEKEFKTWKLNQSIVSLAFSPDGKSLAMGYGSGNIELWDVATGKERIALEGSRRNGGGGIGLLAMSVAFSPDGKLLAAGRFDHTVKLWDAATGKERGSLEGHNGVVFSVSFAPDSKTLASASGDGSVRLWDVATGKVKATLPKDAQWILCVAFSPDGRTVAAGLHLKDDKKYQVKLWNVKSGKERTVLKGYSDEPISSLAFSPDGKTLATTCGDVYSGGLARASVEDRKMKGEIRLWKLVRRPAKK
ncbi:MAG: sigma factor-like helix-turn-helix DNA-binding protein, partial [Gemmataceae bacterium]